MILFIYGVNVSPVIINLTKLLTFPLLVLNTVGSNLSCSNRPHKIFQSNVTSKLLCGSTILDTTVGPT